MKYLAGLFLLAATATADSSNTPFYLKTTSNSTSDSYYINVDNINTSESYATLTKDHNAALPFFWGNGTGTQIQSLFNYGGMSSFQPWAITLLFGDDKASRVMITDHASGPDFTVADDGKVETTNPSFSGFLTCGSDLRYVYNGGKSTDIFDTCENVELTVSTY